MSVIGQVLKEARTKKSVSLEEVHAKIKIHPRILQLLEEEKFDKLPSPLFAKSFLRSYAEFLGVDAESLLGTYENEKQVIAEPEQILYLKPADNAGESPNSLLKWTAGIVAAFVIAAVLFGSPAKVLSLWTAKTKKVSAAKEEKARQEKREKKEASSKATEAKAASEEKTESEWLNSVRIGNFQNINKRIPLDLEIKALDAVWVHVTADGKVLFQGIMKKGAAESWNAKESIEIWTGNASNMLLTLNKNVLGSPGKGVVKKMIISHEGVRIAPQSVG
jgi:cytoskeletal protein RodZ